MRRKDNGEETLLLVYYQQNTALLQCILHYYTFLGGFGRKSVDSIEIM